MRRSIAQLAAFTSLPDLKVVGGKMSLPTLEYPVAGGIAPTITGKQLDLHFNRHHKAYVDKYNTLNAAHYDGLTVSDIVKKSANVPTEKVLFNQAAQHFNHSFYWRCLTPNGKAVSGDLKAQIEKDFGSFEAFKTKFAEAGVANFGSGWTWLVYNMEAKKLEITNTGNAGCPIVDGEHIAPLFTADVWEHAYYADFENRRPDYLKELWAVANWDFAAAQYAKAVQ